VFSQVRLPDRRLRPPRFLFVPVALALLSAGAVGSISQMEGRPLGATLTTALPLAWISNTLAEPEPWNHQGAVPIAEVLFTHDAWARDMLRKINDLRVSESLHPLRLCPALGYAATEYSRKMASSHTLLHHDVDGSGPVDRVYASGYGSTEVAENIAAGFTNPTSTLKAWLVSPSHRAAIFDPGHRHAGFGNHEGYWTQYFGSGGRC
jgi:uncharacterized protein YkwD